jgi:5-methylcytosine-specific restriction endonuclease McrA
MKYCPKCDTSKNEEGFAKDKSRYDGLQGYCKPCRVEMVTKRRKTKEGHKALRKYRSSAKGKASVNAASKKYKQTARGKEKKQAYERKRYHENIEYYRLKNRARKSKGASIAVLKQIQERDKICQLCGSDKELQFDHIRPVSYGGVGTLENLQILCRECNGFKSNNFFLPGGGMLVTHGKLV